MPSTGRPKGSSRRLRADENPDNIVLVDVGSGRPDTSAPPSHVLFGEVIEPRMSGGRDGFHPFEAHEDGDV
jgi:hypothetical protein